MYWTKASFFCLLGIIVLSAKNAAAQDNSPYSRFGLGELSRSENAVNLGMGGVSQAFSSAQSVNFMNPASYSNLQLTTFDVALNGGVRRLNNNDVNSRAGFGTLSYLQLGIPLSKKWGLAFGLRPVSRVSYNIAEGEEKTFFDTLKVPVVHQYEGSGGVYQVFMGTGVGFGGFSVGVNVGYVFGNVVNSSKELYPITAGILPSRHSRRTDYGSFFYNVGIQQTFDLSKDLELTIGATGSLEQKLSARRERMRETLYYDASSDEYDTQDTILYEKGARGEILYPQQFGGGFMLNKVDKFMIGVDYTTAQWGNFRNYGEPDSTQNSWRLSVGGQFVPNASALTGYWNKVTYRLGGYYGKDFVKIGAKDMNAMGFTLGLGLPVRRMPFSYQFSQINAAFEVGTRGDVSIAKETFYKLTLGFTLSDRWFIKTKYD